MVCKSAELFHLLQPLPPSVLARLHLGHELSFFHFAVEYGLSHMEWCMLEACPHPPLQQGRSLNRGQGRLELLPAPSAVVAAECPTGHQAAPLLAVVVLLVELSPDQDVVGDTETWRLVQSLIFTSVEQHSYAASINGIINQSIKFYLYSPYSQIIVCLIGLEQSVTSSALNPQQE